MELTVNGEKKRMDAGASVADLMVSLGFERGTRGLAVAVNDSVVPKPSWHKKALSDGDTVEIIHAVQGG
jgi:sulfur carrier protein